MNGPTAVILCGGGGTRLGGVEKPLRPLLGRSLVERVLERVRPHTADQVIVANQMHGTYARLGRTVDDGAYAGRGPLAGLAAGLAAAHTELVLCVPGDAPLLPPDLLQRLGEALDHAAADVALVHDGGGLQPLCCLLPRRLLPGLLAYLDGGGDAPRQWLAGLRVAPADYAAWPRWGWSLNTPEEWSFAEEQLRQRGEPA